MPDKDGKEISLKDFLGKKVVIYFYPKDSTPGCTKQACGFSENFKKFEENNVVTTIDIISQLHLNKDKYDVTKSFNQNLPIILNLDSDTVARTQEDKMEFIKSLVAMDKENKLSEYIWNGISVFNEIYENEMKLTI